MIIYFIENDNGQRFAFQRGFSSGRWTTKKGAIGKSYSKRAHLISALQAIHSGRNLPRDTKTDLSKLSVIEFSVNGTKKIAAGTFIANYEKGNPYFSDIPCRPDGGRDGSGMLM